MLYNIIGDVHSRSNWSDVVREDAVNVFVGDYFSPYERVSFCEQMKIFNDIISYKESHKETILLIGNHDEDHWHIIEKYSRYDRVNMPYIREAFEENKDKFSIAYAIDDKALVTHAGVSALWYERYMSKDMEYSFVDANVININVDKSSATIEDAIANYKEHTDNMNGKLFQRFKRSAENDIYKWNNGLYINKGGKYRKIEYTPQEIADSVNKLWLDEKYFAFTFDGNNDGFDTYGDDIRQSPIWIRPNALLKSNIFFGTDVMQIVGHTQMLYPQNIHREGHNISFVDCLGQESQSLLFDSETQKTEINIQKNN